MSKIKENNSGVTPQTDARLGGGNIKGSDGELGRSCDSKGTKPSK